MNIITRKKHRLFWLLFTILHRQVVKSTQTITFSCTRWVHDIFMCTYIVFISYTLVIWKPRIFVTLDTRTRWRTIFLVHHLLLDAFKNFPITYSPHQILTPHLITFVDYRFYHLVFVLSTINLNDKRLTNDEHKLFALCFQITLLYLIKCTIV